MTTVYIERKPQFRGDGIRHATINGQRLHLRLTDPTQENFLWINGQQPPLLLDRTAAEFVGHLIDAMWKFQPGEGNESDKVIRYVVDKMYSQYGKPLTIGKKRVTRERIRVDLHRIFGNIMSIAEGACPVELGLNPKEIQYASWIAPARMDLAVTYRCNLNCDKCYLGEKKIKELDTKDWLKIYEILWQIGIPQVVFTGGEPTLRKDIVKLISEADEFVTGLITNGTRLLQLAEPLKKASLDYVQITIESFDAKTHDRMTRINGSHNMTVKGIRESLRVGLQTVTNTTLTKINACQFAKTIQWLSSLGVKNVACNTLICSGRGIDCKQQNGLSDNELKVVLTEACQVAESVAVNLQWYSPTCYTKGVNPIELGFGVKTCSAAAHNMTIQPDGTVLPCQSWPKFVGNILTDNWQKVWNHPTCKKLREHKLKSQKCIGCIFETSCGGSCPLDNSPRKSLKTLRKGGSR